MNETNRNNIPPFVEEQVVEEKQNKIQDILNRFKQPIPQGFVELKLEEGNYLCSTNPKWTDKSLCERYGFYSLEGEWIQLDIPHKLMEDFELIFKQDITYPLYLSPATLEKSPIRGAITIESESEIFLDRPISEKNVEKELEKRMEELAFSRGIITKLEAELKKIEKKINLDLDLEKDLADLKSKCQIKEQEKHNLEVELTSAQQDLAKEKGWWDKWLNDNQDFIISTDYSKDYYIQAEFPDGWTLKIGLVYDNDKDLSDFTFSRCSRQNLKSEIKNRIYKYYLDK